MIYKLLNNNIKIKYYITIYYTILYTIYYINIIYINTYKCN